MGWPIDRVLSAEPELCGVGGRLQEKGTNQCRSADRGIVVMKEDLAITTARIGYVREDLCYKEKPKAIMDYQSWSHMIVYFELAICLWSVNLARTATCTRSAGFQSLSASKIVCCRKTSIGQSCKNVNY